MASRRPLEDPYRTLGVLRGADLEEIKAAHRRLAKRFHPDGTMGDEQRFLAVQEAYQLLSDPARRREWDRRHVPGPSPVRRPFASAGAAQRRGSPAPTDDGSGLSAADDGRPLGRRGSARAARPRPAPGVRTTTWSAEHVPWWDDFQPRARREAGAADGSSDRGPRAHASSPGGSSADGTRGPRGDQDEATALAMDFDVFSRSSGAAWSMAARRHFRRGDDELPSRGAWRYRGTQVVTGAEARKVAAEEAAERSAREAAARTPSRAEERSPR